MKRTLAVVMSHGAVEPPVEEAVDALRSEGGAVTLHGGRDIDGAVRAALDDGADVLVAAGGDGTVNAVANTLLDLGASASVPLAVLPRGTANDFATACGIPTDALDALRLAAAATPVPVDVGQVDGRRFVNAATGGYGAEVTARAPEALKRLTGGLAYFLTGLAHLPGLEGHRTRIRGPGLEWDGDLIGFGIGNGRQAGGGIPFAPEALLDDGLLDVFLLPGSDVSALTELMTALAAGAGIVGENVLTSRTAYLEVEASGTLHVNVDGEPMQQERYRFEVLPRALRICLPPEAPLSHRSAGG